MSFTVQADIYNFKSEETIEDPVVVEWYKYLENEKPENRFGFFNGGELSLFLKYVKGNKYNFPSFPVIANGYSLPVIDPDKRVLVGEKLLSPYIILSFNLLNVDVELPFWLSCITLIPDNRALAGHQNLPFSLIGLII